MGKLSAALSVHRWFRGRQAAYRRRKGLEPTDVPRGTLKEDSVGKILGFLSGKKAYGLGILATAVGVMSMTGYPIPGLPAMDGEQSLQMIVTGLATAFLRAGIAKK